MSVNNINGKRLKRADYHILKELGIEIVIYELTVHQTDSKIWYGFEIRGGLNEKVDLDELHDLLVLLKIAKESNAPAIKDALDQLKIAVELSK